MDIQRPSETRRRKQLRHVLAAMGTLLVLAAVTVGLSRLKPAAPALSKASVWVDTVKRGSMLREVRGTGALVPVEVRWVPTLSQGRVEKICVQPGAMVQADTVLVELSNPELEQAALDAGWQSQAEEAELEKQRVNLESARLTQLSVVASTRHDATQAELEAQADEELAAAGLVPQLVLKKSRAKAEELKARLEIEEKRLVISGDSTKAQLAVQSTKVRQLKAQAVLKRSQVDGLKIRSGIDGVLQKLGDKDPLQVGQQLVAGANVARVVDPDRLKAEIKIPETQARDVQIGQFAVVDTRNGVAEGEVVRIDPAVQNGTVTIDVSLRTALPKGARPDLSVEGTVRLEHLEDVINVGRPVQGQAETTVQIFKIAQGGRDALKVPVKLGRMSVNTVEVLQGLQPGDRVIISDMSQWDTYERVRLY